MPQTKLNELDGNSSTSPADAESLRQLRQLVEEEQYAAAEHLLESMNAGDRTRLLSRLPPSMQQNLVTNIEVDQAADYIHELPDVQAVELLDDIAPAQAATILEGLPKDEQADLIGELPAESMDAILSAMPDVDASAVRTLVEFDDDEAGGLMVVEFLSFDERESVNGVIEHLRQNVERYTDFDVQYAYVVDADGRLKGVLRLRDLLLSPGELPVSRAMIDDPLSVSTNTPLRELYKFFAEHGFIGVPVVDQADRLVGVLRRVDVEEAMAERYAEDYRKTQGIVNEELRTMPLFLRSRRRLAWLSINIVLNVIAASVIALYQDTLAQVIALAVFLPIISDMSGCSGNQAVAVSMRELSLGLVDAAEVVRVWLKEVTVGMINGLALGLLIGAVAYLWKGNMWLGGVVGLAMMVNTILAVSIGGTLPLIMRLLKLDPALASGPILTTVTDMCGFFLVLSGASLVLPLLV